MRPSGDRLRVELRRAATVLEASGVGTLCLGLVSYGVVVATLPGSDPAAGTGLALLVVDSLVTLVFASYVGAAWLISALLGFLLLRRRRIWPSAMVILGIGSLMVVLAGLLVPRIVLLAAIAALPVGLIVCLTVPALRSDQQ